MGGWKEPGAVPCVNGYGSRVEDTTVSVFIVVYSCSGGKDCPEVCGLGLRIKLTEGRITGEGRQSNTSLTWHGRVPKNPKAQRPRIELDQSSKLGKRDKAKSELGGKATRMLSVSWGRFAQVFLGLTFPS